MLQQTLTDIRRPDIPRAVEVLVVSPHPEDHVVLQRLFGHSNWTLHRSMSVAEALRWLATHTVPVVLCEHALPDGTWLDVLQAVQTFGEPPQIIVTSRSADHRLWGEVLNLGGYDVLQKPFDSRELYRVIPLAWQHWRYSHAEAGTARAAAAAS